MADMFRKVLIANRGEIAVRIQRTLRKLGIASVAVYSDADRHARHVLDADIAVGLGGNTPAESYLQADRILNIALHTGAEAIIPGYGFLSENAAFAESCEQAGIAFVGPTPPQIREFGLKHTAREIAIKAGVPLAPGTELLRDIEQACQKAERITYPVMLKSTAGGGGIGLTRCADEASLRQAFESVQRLGQNFFANSGVFLERFVSQARHVEVQIFGDGLGKVLALGDRDCSLQRRNQKVMEETPAPDLPAATRAALFAATERLGQSVAYRSAGTVEFMYEADRDAFYFLEVNTRLQVEHPITEMVTGIDLIEWMLQTAAGHPPVLDHRPETQGVAIEARLYAEDPLKDFQPSPGTLTEVVFPEDIRVDSYVESGSEISSFYDPMIAKIIVHGQDRQQAVAKLQNALTRTRIAGIVSNLDYLRQISRAPLLVNAQLSTTALSTFTFHPRVAEILDGGTYSTIQDIPGRVGYWHIGVPPSGPMDDYAFALANRLVGNPADAAGMECTLVGAKIRFQEDTHIALTGADLNATLDGQAIKSWQSTAVRAGQILDMGRMTAGCRAYLAVAGGFDVPAYLGSRSTFALGQFGGHGGRPVRSGDLLPLGVSTVTAPTASIPAELIPSFTDHWTIGVLYGPHGAPDFFQPEFIQQFFATDWEVHYNSNRLGIRLIGPRPTWARSDGGEAGLHPSNIHDTEYAIGAINFTGDMPVILGKDGPSLGGFVCPATIAKAELWKVGQLKPGDRIRFVPLDFDTALRLEQLQENAIQTMASPAEFSLLNPPACTSGEAILGRHQAQPESPTIVYRQAGDHYVLLEYGDNVLDLRLRFRVHALMEALNARNEPGIEELSPGVRSLQIRYDSQVIPQAQLIAVLQETENRLPSIQSMQVPGRIVHLPLAFEDSATLEAVSRYRQSVRDTAPWLPNNVEFIRRMNGLDSVQDVVDTIYDASYLVLGLGDVYLGAPCAVPIDPRHRLRTSKYNPARTFTAEGTVGIGGVYMCIYGMDSPGGYQLVGRTLPIWNTYLRNPQFAQGKPWLLRFFDQVRFYPVTEDELTQHREAFRYGTYQINIEETVFDLGAYEQFLEENASEIAHFQSRQDEAFAAEVTLWSEQDLQMEDVTGASQDQTRELDEFEIPVPADMTSSVWKYLVEPGASVKSGEPLVILEAMKMEFTILAPCSGVVSAHCCKTGELVRYGVPLLILDTREQVANE